MEIKAFEKPGKDEGYVELSHTDSELYSSDWRRKRSVEMVDSSELQPLIDTESFGRNDHNLRTRTAVGSNVTDSGRFQKEGKFKEKTKAERADMQSFGSRKNESQTDGKVDFQSYDQFNHTDSELYKKEREFQSRKEPVIAEVQPLIPTPNQQASLQCGHEFIGYTDSELLRKGSKENSHKRQVKMLLNRKKRKSRISLNK
jgi:hypothetical protein